MENKNKLLSYYIVLLLFYFVQLGAVNLKFFAFLNLVLILSIYVLLDDYRPVVWWLIIVAALVTEIFSPFSYGILFLVYLVVCWFIYYLGRKLLTNRSLYTILFLGILGSLLYKFVSIFLVYLYDFGLQGLTFVKEIFVAVIIEIVLLSMLYFINQHLRKKLYHG